MFGLINLLKMCRCAHWSLLDNMLYPENDPAGQPSAESSNDPAPAKPAPQTEQQGINEKSKYEASAVYKRPKGDRLSWVWAGRNTQSSSNLSGEIG